MQDITLNSKHYRVAVDKNGSPLIRRSQRPSQPKDAGALEYADWRVDGHDFNSTEVGGYLGREYGAGTDGRWEGVDTLGPKINTLVASTYDTAQDIVRDANCAAVANAVWATSYLYVGRGTRPAKIDLSDMSLKDGGVSLPKPITDLIVTVGAQTLSFADAGTYPISTASRPVAISPDGNYLFTIDAAGANLLVLDVTDPANMTLVGSVATNGRSALVADSSYVYAAGLEVIEVIDVSDPANPSVVGTDTDALLTDPAFIALSADGDYVYVCDASNDRITVVSIATPASPSVVGSVTDNTNLDGVRSLAVASATYVYAACWGSDRLTVVDVSTPASPSVTGSVSDGTDLNGAYGVQVATDTDYVVVACLDGKNLAVVDVSMPASPSVTGSVSLPTATSGAVYPAVDPDGTYVYVLGRNALIWTVSIATPASPTLVETSNAATGFFPSSVAYDSESRVIYTFEPSANNTRGVHAIVSSSLEIAAGQGDTLPYYVLPVADLGNPDNSQDDTWAANDDSVAARVFGLAPDRVVKVAKNVVSGNILTGATTMASPAWNTVATIEAKRNIIKGTGFAIDGNLWIVGTNDGPYVLDERTRKFFPLMPELDISDDHCRNMAEWFPVGVVMPLQYALRWQRYGSGKSFGAETFRNNSSPVQGTPTAWSASEREGYEIRYNPETDDSWLIAWREREPGDQHAGILSPYVIARFTDTSSNFLRWLGTVDGLRTNPTLCGGYDDDIFWLTAGRTARWIDDANYRFTTSGTTYLTEMTRLAGVLADIEAVELQTDNCTANRTVTVGLSINGGSAVNLTAITSDGFHRQNAVDGSGVPLATLQGAYTIKPQIAYATNDDTEAPMVVGGKLRVYYRTRPKMIPVTTYTVELTGDALATPEEQEEALRALEAGVPVELQDIDHDSVYVRVTGVGVVKTENVGSGPNTSTGMRRTVEVTVEEWSS